MMDSDERDVYFHLKSQPQQFVPANSICRQAGGKHRYRESPDWAKPVLLRMLDRGIVEVDSNGAYRLKPVVQNVSGSKRWMSPEITAILKKSGRKFDTVRPGECDADTYYNNL